MKRAIGSVLLVVVLVTGACAGGERTASEYVADYGGSEAQYEAILSDTDCQHLAQTAADMDARYDRERDRVALGYQSAAVDRMRTLDCP